MAKKECYICGKKATSKEHVPPKSIFPEDPKYRKNLITVPSCDDHNLEKSCDDEYFFFIMTSLIGSQSVPNDVSDKIIRALQKSTPKRRGFLRNEQPIIVEGKPTGSFNLNYERLSTSLGLISKALYFHEFKRRWNKSVFSIVPGPNIFVDSPDFIQFNQILIQSEKPLANHYINIPKKGDNPDIFYYHFLFDNRYKKYVLRTVYYSGTNVYTLFGPNLGVIK